MEVKLYEDEILIIAKDIEEIGQLNDFFNKSNPNRASDAFETKAMVRKDEKSYRLEVSIMFTR